MSNDVFNGKPINDRDDALEVIGELAKKHNLDRGELTSVLGGEFGIRTRGDLVFQVREANTCLLIALRDILPHMKEKLCRADIPEVLCGVQAVLDAVCTVFMQEDFDDLKASQKSKEEQQ